MGARILHIEDDPKNRLLVRKLLVAAGHEVIDAENGIEGVRLAGQVLPDLVLVDINIPDLDGYEVILRLRGIESLAHIPLVAITAEGDKQTTLAVGADGFISKPIEAARFAQIVESYMRGRKDLHSDSPVPKLRERSQKIVEHLEQKVVALSAANAQLEEMARLRREFLQNLSHELATPMTPIVGYLKLLMDGEFGPLPPQQQKVLRSVESSSLRLRGLIETLLDVSSLETGRMMFQEQTFDLKDVMRSALLLQKGRVESQQLNLLEAYPDQPMICRGDADKVQRAMMHVLDNAIKFTAAGGRIAVELRKGNAQALGRSMWFEIVIADDGSGVPPHQLEKILQPFYQADGSATRVHGGVGLGLAFARRVIEAHGGSIEVESPPKHNVAGQRLTGTQVTLRMLPEGKRLLGDVSH